MTSAFEVALVTPIFKVIFMKSAVVVAFGDISLGSDVDDISL